MKDLFNESLHTFLMLSAMLLSLVVVAGSLFGVVYYLRELFLWIVVNEPNLEMGATIGVCVLGTLLFLALISFLIALADKATER